MNKKVLFFLILILALLGYIFKIDKIIVIEFTNLTNNIKSTYKNYYNSIQNNISNYFDQTEQLSSLKVKLEEYKQFKLLYTSSSKRVKELENNKINDKNLSIKYVEVLSYLHMNDFSKVLLDTDIKIDDKILALSTIDGHSAGIVIQQDNQIIAYLNNNEKCNYAVFIGTNNIPGITSGTNKQNNLIIKYIPKWNEIKVGDEVITSGMDNIFPSGLNVGVVLRVETNSNTQTAYIKPSVDVLANKYFYIIKK